jgi:hypothetical protein
MVPDTVVGLLIVVVAVLPGLMYTLSFERQAGDFGATFADRTMRFIAASVGFHVLAAWPEYLLFRTVLRELEPAELTAGQFAALWVAGILLVGLPAVAGTLLGHAYANRSRLGGAPLRMLGLVLGRDVAPRAWDDFFSERPTTYLRVRTAEGTLLGGLFANRSYAAGFPHDPDLLLEEAYGVDPDTGELDRPLGYPLYIPAGQIAWMEIVRPQRIGDAADA